MLAQRLPHQNHAPSPFRTVTGIWAPPFQPPHLLLPLDVILAVLNEHGEELFRSTDPGVFAAGPNYVGADAGALVQAADGLSLGTITHYGVPDDPSLIPVTWVRPTQSILTLSHFERTLRARGFGTGASSHSGGRDFT